MMSSRNTARRMTMNNTCAAGTQRRHTYDAAQPRTVRRGQRLSVLEIVVLGVILALLVAGVVSARTSGSTSVATQTLQVRSGDTLWSIAEAHPAPGLSTAQTVESIERDNQLATGALTEGQTLRVPGSCDHVQEMAAR
jgi:hypothetical protein